MQNQDSTGTATHAAAPSIKANPHRHLTFRHRGHSPLVIAFALLGAALILLTAFILIIVGFSSL